MKVRGREREGGEMSLYAMILAGGAGTRFWPLSREQYPKQLLKLLGDATLLQQTLQRVAPLIPPERTVVITQEGLAEEVRRQIPPRVSLLTEPCGRNTAPAAILAALWVSRRDPEAVMVILPSDHVIKNRRSFLSLLKTADRASRSGYLVTFGIPPEGPETGYGYLKRGAPLPHKNVYRVDRFVEKPTRSRAQRFLSTGRYYWNSGVFVFQASTLLTEAKRFVPQIARQLTPVAADLGTPKGQERLKEVYPGLPAISLDHGIMEKTDRAVLIPAHVGWSDVGSWSALQKVVRTDKKGNLLVGHVLDLGSEGSVLFGDKRLVATIGLKDMVVVDTEDATLVCPKERAQEVKAVVEILKTRKAQESLVHRTVFRPWGSYTVLEEGEGYKIKRIVVNPGARLSLQMHHRRSEHWVVVAGTARVTCGEKVYDVPVHESTFIPLATKHRLENRGREPLQIIEVQNGDYLGEDDIARFDDDYGRTNPT